MFAYINGKIADKANNYVVIDAGGVGYKIFMSTKAIESLNEIGTVQKIYTYYYVREDNISLYGFLSSCSISSNRFTYFAVNKTPFSPVNLLARKSHPSFVTR